MTMLDAVMEPAPRGRKRVADESDVDDLENLLKRVRLRPSIGQLRLKTEVQEWFNMQDGETLPRCSLGSPRPMFFDVWRVECVSVDLSKLSASFHAFAPGHALELEFTFPTAYPHAPPQVVVRPSVPVFGLQLDDTGRAAIPANIPELGELWRPVHSAVDALTAVLRRWLGAELH